MKDSGIKWIGNIPDTWNVIKVKYNCSLKGRIGWQGLTTDEYVDEGPFLITGTDFNVNDGVINWDSCVHVSEWRYDQAPEIQVHNGDLLITKDGTVGKVAIVTNMTDKTTLNSGVMVIRPTEGTYETKFLYYVLKSEEFWKWFNYINSGNTTISHLYQHDLNHFYFAITDKTEQRAIIDFLDKKCQKADVIINKVREQIEILNNAKNSMIKECISLGIQEERSIKHSGVDYIGEINEKYDVKKVKYVSKIKTGTTPEKKKGITDEKAENSIPWYTPGDFNSFSLNNGGQFIEKNIITPFPANSVFMVTIGATLGKIAISKEECYCNQQITALIPSINDKYLLYSLSSNLEWLKLISSSTTLAQLNNNKLGDIKIIVPPDKEQEVIVKYLDEKCAVIDRIIKKKQNELNILEEQKKSLINEYITGKKRVKGYT